MNPMPDYMVVIKNDRLVKRWWDPKRKEIVNLPKRVSAKCALTKEERHAYAHKGIAACVRLVRLRLRLSITDAFAIVKKEATYGER